MESRFKILDHPTPNCVDVNDPKTFASTILWLEDQKIRLYNIKDRAGLRKINNLQKWEKSYEKYKSDLKVPNLNSRIEELCWIMEVAIRLEYKSNIKKYKYITSEKILQKKSLKKSGPIIKAENSLDRLNFNSNDFINGVHLLANKLGIAYHPNHLIQLEAIKRIIKERLCASSSTRKKVEGIPFPFEKGDDVIIEDKQLDYPARVLRLLQIQSLRLLQTKINEAIVVIQNITANPKTDTKLGKVGF